MSNITKLHETFVTPKERFLLQALVSQRCADYSSRDVLDEHNAFHAKLFKVLKSELGLQLIKHSHEAIIDYVCDAVIHKEQDYTAEISIDVSGTSPEVAAERAVEFIQSVVNQDMNSDLIVTVYDGIGDPVTCNVQIDEFGKVYTTLSKRQAVDFCTN